MHPADLAELGSMAQENVAALETRESMKTILRFRRHLLRNELIRCGVRPPRGLHEVKCELRNGVFYALEDSRPVP